MRRSSRFPATGYSPTLNVKLPWSIARALMRVTVRHLFDLRHGVLAVHLFGVELDFMTRFDGRHVIWNPHSVGFATSE